MPLGQSDGTTQTMFIHKRCVNAVRHLTQFDFFSQLNIVRWYFCAISLFCSFVLLLDRRWLHCSPNNASKWFRWFGFHWIWRTRSAHCRKGGFGVENWKHGMSVPLALYQQSLEFINILQRKTWKKLKFCGNSSLANQLNVILEYWKNYIFLEQKIRCANIQALTGNDLIGINHNLYGIVEFLLKYCDNFYIFLI